MHAQRIVALFVGALVGAVVIPLVAADSPILVEVGPEHAVDVTPFAAASEPVAGAPLPIFCGVVGVCPNPPVPVTLTLTGCMDYARPATCEYNGAIVGYRAPGNVQRFALATPGASITLPDVLAGSRIYAFVMDWAGTDTYGQYTVKLATSHGESAFTVRPQHVVPLDRVSRLNVLDVPAGTYDVQALGGVVTGQGTIREVAARYPSQPRDALAAFSTMPQTVQLRIPVTYGVQAVVPVLGDPGVPALQSGIHLVLTPR